jgi:hypothetical protein
MLQHAPHATKAPPPEPPALSLIRGGLLFRLCRRAHVSGTLWAGASAALAMSLLAWFPLFLLSIIDGRAFGGAVTIPFVDDGRRTPDSCWHCRCSSRRRSSSTSVSAR